MEFAAFSPRTLHAEIPKFAGKVFMNNVSKNATKFRIYRRDLRVCGALFSGIKDTEFTVKTSGISAEFAGFVGPCFRDYDAEFVVRLR